MSEPEFKAGQLIEATAPDGETRIRGFLMEGSNGFNIDKMGWSVEALRRIGFAIVILREPPIKEPTGLFAIVRLQGGVAMRRIGSHWCSWDLGSALCNGARWSEIQDRVDKVLFEGVSDECA